MQVARPEFPAPILIIDEFFSPDIATECLQECIDLRRIYMPASVGFGLDNRRDPRIRQNEVVMMDNVFRADRSRSVILTALDKRIKEQDCRDLWHEGYYIFDNINYATWKETVLSRYGKCDFYGNHQDTIIGSNETNAITKRNVTMVVYLNREPEQFTGGELTLHEKGKSLTVPPKHNRAVVFPSFTVHGVGKVALTSGAGFEGSRFSINHWLGFDCSR